MTLVDDEKAKSAILLLLMDFIRARESDDVDLTGLMDQLAAIMGSEREAFIAYGLVTARLLFEIIHEANPELDIAECIQNVAISGLGISETGE